ncbi:uroporphyrinogen-III synthase [Chelatococcus reniformis]|uniref:Uroporphyrinogen-III synthase n=1 Tax=Chelatococcus reniformis TaxID=1494448 RepID=A0A916TX82_9HYPH|nr:uroporphyrinogen-III synthase [Chelatococcus reniformis]GGC49965.1 uroporphyrinogen III methyltransferase [Chelatococcus reniformis]
MRVLVTRPQPFADRTARLLAARGHQPLVAPLLRIAPSGEPMPRGEWDAIVLTSASALIAFPEPPTLVPVFAVGDRTAEAAEEAGFQDVRSASGDREALALLARETLPPHQRLLVAAGRDRKEDLDRLLHEAGHEAHVWTAYVAEAETQLPAAARQAIADRSAGHVLHYSRRSASICVALAREEGLDQVLSSLNHVCISEDAAEPVRACGAASILVAGHPSEDAMLALLPRA